MTPRGLLSAAGIVLVLAACTSGPGSASPSPAASPGCERTAQTAEPGSVAVSIKDFEFEPAAIEARAGQVIAFTNTGFEHHNATLDGGGCATTTLATDERDGLVFTTAGRYGFHCSVHTWMTGTISIAR
jgi:plastocyanin